MLFKCAVGDIKLWVRLAETTTGDIKLELISDWSGKVVICRLIYIVIVILVMHNNKHMIIEDIVLILYLLPCILAWDIYLELLITWNPRVATVQAEILNSKDHIVKAPYVYKIDNE
jgi:hypothetical protein